MRCPREMTRQQGKLKLMVDIHNDEDNPLRDNTKRLMAENMGLRQALEAATKSEAAEVAASGELKAQIFDLSQQQLRQLMQIADREDALALAAAREDDLEQRLMRTEREAIVKQDEIRDLTTLLLNLRMDLELARTTAGCVPELREKLQMLEGQVAELKASTSWRITSPLRKVKDGLNFLSRS